MLLKDVRLYLNSDEFPQMMRSEFLFRSCYISNFLTRRVREWRLSREFKGILIQGCHAIAPVRISPEKNLIASIKFSSTGYETLRPGDEHEFFIAMLAEGLELCAEQHEIPITELKEAIEEFRRGGYRNEWTHQQKRLGPVNLQASLLCSMDPERFRLTLRLEKKATTVFERQILETKPDELIFAHRFKEVVLEGDSVIVKDKFGKPIFSMPFASLQ